MTEAIHADMGADKMSSSAVRRYKAGGNAVGRLTGGPDGRGRSQSVRGAGAICHCPVATRAHNAYAAALQHGPNSRATFSVA